MRRVGVLFFFMLILILTAAPIDVAAADGDVSSESIGEDYSHKFRETLPDDTLHFPDLDAYWNTTDDNADAYADYDGGGIPIREGTIADTYSNDTNNQYLFSMGSTSNYIYMRYNLTFSNINAFDDYHLKTHALWDSSDSGSFDARLRIYNFTAGSWGNLFSYTGTTTQDHHRDDALSETNHIDPTVVTATIWVSFECRRDILFQGPFIRVYYVANTFEADTISGYSESFSNVSDCLIMDDEGDDTFSSDGDLLHFESKTDSENDGESVYSNVPSLVGQYLEIRYRLNTTSLAIFAVGTYSSDGGLAGNINWFGMTITTSWTTSKFPINSDTVIESVRLYIYHVTGQPPVDLQVDYLRVGPSDEMGWQHDGSTTAGVEEYTNSEYTYYISTDGDILNMTSKRGTGSDTDPNAYYKIYYDTTATKADLETDYYQFFEMRYKAPSGVPYIYVYVDSKVVYESLIEDSDWHTLRYNIAAGSASSGAYVRIQTDYTYVDDDVGTVLIDYAKIYSIANFTVLSAGTADTGDYLYVDSNALEIVCDENPATGYLSIDYDPALTVNTATYNVWNLTLADSNPTSALFDYRFYHYVAAWYYDDDETRGDFNSGTLTDITIRFYSSDNTLSAIKFIEDSTAPAVVRSSSTPNDPEDDEAVTLSAVITDTIEVYSVAFNAIVYPTGFSDVDYSANEQADNLWNYMFSSLDAGYYCFKIIASDGANTNALTEYAYIELTVREAAIRVEEITLIGAGSDFSMMTFSARINRDCSFTIYEESASSPESDTHTGSVTAPSFNLAWTKLDVDDANVNFTIRFTSGSLTYNYTSQYQVAQTTFYVSTVTQMVSLDTVTVTGRITKLGAYQVYDDLNVLKDYGSITDLDFKIQFTRWGGYDEQNHDFAIKFTNGTQTCWYNSSFYAFKKPVVAVFPTTDPNVLYAFQASFWTAVMIFFVMLMIGIDFYRRNK